MLEKFDEELLKKMAVGIGDASKITGVPIRKIRYWESKHIISSTVDGENVNRKYDYFTVKKIILVSELVEEGYTLDKAAEKVKMRMESTENAYDLMKRIDGMDDIS